MQLVYYFNDLYVLVNSTWSIPSCFFFLDWRSFNFSSASVILFSHKDMSLLYCSVTPFSFSFSSTFFLSSLVSFSSSSFSYHATCIVSWYHNYCCFFENLFGSSFMHLHLLMRACWTMHAWNIIIMYDSHAFEYGFECASKR